MDFGTIHLFLLWDIFGCFCRFSPPILLFLLSIIPSIWILELHQQDKDSDPAVPRRSVAAS